ncbi:hypothetical protein RKD20_000533 [Streptomyces sp. SLBN-8D4]
MSPTVVFWNRPRMVTPVGGKRGQNTESRDGRTMTTSVTAGTGTAELEGEDPARGGIELSHVLRDTDGHLHIPPGPREELTGE